MNTDDRTKTAKLYECAAVVGVELTPTRAASYVRLLADVSPAALSAALDAHLNDPEASRYRPFPLPADIRAKLPSQQASAHLPADTAWAIALTASDESETVIMTNEIAQALEAARPVLEAGDKVGARMAFRGAYERLTATGGQPVYRVSVGHDPAKRAAALDQAQRMGLLTREQAAQYLPAPVSPKAEAAVAGLLAGNVLAFPGQARPDPAAKLAELRAMLVANAREAPRPTPAPVGPEEMETALRRLERARSALEADPYPDGLPLPQAACSESYGP